MRHIHLIDTAVASDNLGDEIIVSEVRRQLAPLIGDAYVTTSSGHDGLGRYGRRLAASADIALLMGTNALSARFRSWGKFIWSVRRADMAALEGKVVLMGVGANGDFDHVGWRQKAFLRRLLSPDHIHSVRDETGLAILNEIGRKGINTSCPTLWRYRDRPVQARADKAPEVVFTLTKHKPSDHDAEMIAILRRNYERLHFWPQQPRDLDYLRGLGDTGDINVLPANLAAYDDFLANTDADVVGTRLHGTIRGLRYDRRGLVITIDNRARDIGRETGLATLPRDEIPGRLDDKLNDVITNVLDLPNPAIDSFLNQLNAPSK